MNAPIEAPKGFSGRWVETSETQTAGRHDDPAIVALAAGSDE
jgi:hypothetical protein